MLKITQVLVSSSKVINFVITSHHGNVLMKNGTFYEKMGQLLPTNVCEKIPVFSSEKN